MDNQPPVQPPQENTPPTPTAQETELLEKSIQFAHDVSVVASKVSPLLDGNSLDVITTGYKPDVLPEYKEVSGQLQYAQAEHLKARKPTSKLTFLVPILAGIIVIAFALLSIKTHQVPSSYITTTGYALSMSSKDGSGYAYTIRYTDSSGKIQSYHGHSAQLTYHSNSPAKIAYNPKNPAQAINISAKPGNSLGSIVAIVFGAFIIVFGIFGLIKTPRRVRQTL
jgi:hypothetical protein